MLLVAIRGSSVPQKQAQTSSITVYIVGKDDGNAQDGDHKETRQSPDSLTTLLQLWHLRLNRSTEHSTYLEDCDILNSGGPLPAHQAVNLASWC